MSLPYLQPYLGLSNGLNTLHGAGAGGDPSAASGGWVELGRTTLGTTGSEIDVTGLANKRYLMLLSLGLQNGSINTLHRVGNGSIDTGSNYAQRNSLNGGTDGTSTNSSYLSNDGRAGIDDRFGVSYIANYASKEKLMITHWVHQNAAGAANAAQRDEGVGKWTNTSNVIDQIRYLEAHTGTFASGSELVVLGWDPADTHSNNFWEELASVEAGGSSTDMSSGTITAKKYLWIQLYQKGIAGDVRLRFNSDSGNNYNRRYSQNGAADGTDTSAQHISNMIGLGSTPSFGNAFIINIASKEKLVMGHHVQQNAAGAGSAPQRIEFVGKWANTSNQITNVNILSSSGNFPSGSILKVFGSD